MPRLPHVRSRSKKVPRTMKRTAAKTRRGLKNPSSTRNKGKKTLAARETAVCAREDAAGLREEAVRAREQANLAAEQLQTLMQQVRDANEQLVIASVRAQTLTDEAEQANRLKDEFLATVSHELRTPVNAILGWARMLAERQLKPDRAAHAIKTIERNAGALVHLIDDLLDVSRIIAGHLQLTSQPVDMAKVTEAAVETARLAAAAKNVQINCSTDPSSAALVSGDSSRLQQIVGNLLSNAVKFTAESGRIEATVQSAASHVVVRVSDTGQGISPEFLPHVFERFRQAEGGTTRRHTGLGLGLAIARELTELHGGTVRAESPGIGHGAVFTVRLPLLAVAAPAKPSHPRHETGLAPAQTDLERLDGISVLLVEDHPDSRELMTMVLEQAGAAVTAVGSVAEATDALETIRPDVLVSDIGLPGEDGYSLIRRIRLHEAKQGGSLPAIALTGYARDEDHARVISAGFETHLVKPVEPLDLTRAVSELTHSPQAFSSKRASPRGRKGLPL